MTKRPGEVFTPAEIEAILASFPETRVGVRDRAMVAVTVYAGLRCSETLALRRSDVDLDDCSVLVRSGKGGKRGVVGLNPAVRPFLEALLALDKRGGVDDDLLFRTRSGKRVLPCYFRAVMSRVGDKARIPHRCHPHALRHTCAVQLAKAKVPVPIISKQLRHSNISTTATYLDHFAATEVVDAVRAIEW